MIWYEVMGDDLVYTYSNAQFPKAGSMVEPSECDDR